MARPIEGDNESNSKGRIKRGSTLSTLGSPVLSGNPLHPEEEEMCVCVHVGVCNVIALVDWEDLCIDRNA